MRYPHLTRHVQSLVRVGYRYNHRPSPTLPAEALPNHRVRFDVHPEGHAELTAIRGRHLDLDQEPMVPIAIEG